MEETEYMDPTTYGQRGQCDIRSRTQSKRTVITIGYLISTLVCSERYVRRRSHFDG